MKDSPESNKPNLIFYYSHENCPARATAMPVIAWLGEKDISYEIQTDDPDGDEVNVSVEGEMPPGMTWDEDSRTISWNTPEDVEPKEYIIEIIASDNDGGKYIQTVTIDIQRITKESREQKTAE